MYYKQALGGIIATSNVYLIEKKLGEKADLPISIIRAAVHRDCDGSHLPLAPSVSSHKLPTEMGDSFLLVLQEKSTVSYRELNKSSAFPTKAQNRKKGCCLT